MDEQIFEGLGKTRPFVLVEEIPQLIRVREANLVKLFAKQITFFKTCRRVEAGGNCRRFFLYIALALAE